jgi:hypothetical protein
MQLALANTVPDNDILTHKHTYSLSLTHTHYTVTEPSVSTEGSFLTMALFFAKRVIASASEMVTTAGKPSGIIATAMATADLKAVPVSYIQIYTICENDRGRETVCLLPNNEQRNSKLHVLLADVLWHQTHTHTHTSSANFQAMKKVTTAMMIVKAAT